MNGKELIRDPFNIPDAPEDIPAAPRAVLAFELRKVGMSYEDIAVRLGYANANTAMAAIHQRIKKYYSLNEDEIKHIVGLELARLDALQLLAWREATRDEDDVNLKAIDSILKIMERRTKLLGLDKENETPTTVNQTAVFVAGSKNEYLEGIERAREMIGGTNGPE